MWHQIFEHRPWTNWSPDAEDCQPDPLVLMSMSGPLKDRQNSVRKVVDTTGSVVANDDYYAFGKVLSAPKALDLIFRNRAFGEVQGKTSPCPVGERTSAAGRAAAHATVIG